MRWSVKNSSLLTPKLIEKFNISESVPNFFLHTCETKISKRKYTDRLHSNSYSARRECNYFKRSSNNNNTSNNSNRNLVNVILE